MTGSLIRDTEAAGSKLTVIGRDQIDASGYGKIEDVLATVTQNFNQANAAVVEGGDVFNYNRGAEVQLRGLGAGTTLTLINGQRQGASGFQGTFTDVSTIPASAVERIEILPEGAAALYGSDAIGGVVNIILRKNFDGFEARCARAPQAAMPTSGQSPHSGVTPGRVAMCCWAFSTTTALPWHAAHAPIAPPTLTSGASAAVTCAVSAATPAPFSIRNTGTPIAAIPHGQDGTQLTAAQLIPGAVNYTNNVIDNDILPQSDHAQRLRELLLPAGRQLGDIGRRPLFVARVQIHVSATCG